MKILFIIPPPSLPNRLHRNRSYEFIKILSINHDVHLLSVTTENKQTKDFEEIKKICKATVVKLNKIHAMLNCLFFPLLPLEVAFCYSPIINKIIKKIIKDENIDLIYAKRLRSAIYLSHVNIPTILDSTDAMSMFYSRMSENHGFPKNIFYKLEEIKYKAFEKKIIRKINNWVVCSPVDKEYLDNLEKSCNISVIPNPVDLNYFTTKNQKVIKNSLLYRGLMDKPVNINAVKFFVKDVFPLVQKKVKDARLYVVGPNPKKSVKKLADKHITVTGFVKDDREYLSKTSLTICPIKIGSGTRFKIIQSWAMKKPVVSTSVGAEGLLCKHNENILIADTPQAFADKIINLLNNKKLYAKIAKNGYETAKRFYSIENIEKQIEVLVLRSKIKNQNANIKN